MKNVIILMLFCFNFAYSSKRVISLDAAAIETIYAMGKEDLLVGIVQMRNKIYPYEKTSKLPKVGTFQLPSIEKILALKPDLVILSQYSQGTKQKLEEFGIRTMEYRITSLQEMYKRIEELGIQLEAQSEAQKIIEEFRSKLKQIADRPIRKKGIFLYSSNPLTAFGKEGLIGDILSSIGVINIAQDTAINQPVLSREFILTQEVNFILFGLSVQSESKLLEDNDVLKQTLAYQRGNIAPFDTYRLLRASPLIIEGITNLYHTIQNFE